MKLHWSPRSPYVRKVMVVAHERGLADRLELIRSPVAMTAPHAGVMKDNPLSKIPTLITDSGEVLYDSITICEYLDHLAGKPTLFPAPGPDRWLAMRRHALGNGFIDMLIFFRDERARPDGARSQPHIDAYGIKAKATLDALEREADALAAAPVSIGTLTIAIALGYLDFRFGDLKWRDGRPRLTAFEKAYMARPSIAKTVAEEG